MYKKDFEAGTTYVRFLRDHLRQFDTGTDGFLGDIMSCMAVFHITPNKILIRALELDDSLYGVIMGILKHAFTIGIAYAKDGEELHLAWTKAVEAGPLSMSEVAELIKQSYDPEHNIL